MSVVPAYALALYEGVERRRFRSTDTWNIGKVTRDPITYRDDLRSALDSAELRCDEGLELV